MTARPGAARDLAGKAAIVVGGTRTMGLAVAEQLAARGAALTVSHQHDAAAAQAALKTLRELGPDVAVVRADAADAERLFAASEARHRRLDIVVHVAGRGLKKALAHTSDEEFEAVMNGNARGAFLTLRQSASRIADGGRVVLMSTALTGLSTGQSIRARPATGRPGCSPTGRPTGRSRFEMRAFGENMRQCRTSHQFGNPLGGAQSSRFRLATGLKPRLERIGGWES